VRIDGDEADAVDQHEARKGRLQKVGIAEGRDDEVLSGPLSRSGSRIGSNDLTMALVSARDAVRHFCQLVAIRDLLVHVDRDL
jgi:hypothetical protein